MNRVIKKYCIHIALCWLAVLLSVFLTPGLSVRAVETVNNGAEPEASEASGQAQPEYGSLDELTGKLSQYQADAEKLSEGLSEVMGI